MSYIIQCLASKQSIPEGDPCRFLPIQHCARASDGAAGKAPTYKLTNDPGPIGVWDAIGGFIPGTAEDCGRMEFSDEALDGLQQFFRSLYIYGRGGDEAVCLRDSFADVAPTLKEQIANRAEAKAPASELRAMWGIVQEQLANDSLFLPDYAAQFRPVAFAVVHEYAWQHLIEVGQGAHRKPIRIVEELAAILERDKDVLPNADLSPDLRLSLRASSAFMPLSDYLGRIAMENGFPNMEHHAETLIRAARLCLDGAQDAQIFDVIQPVLDEALVMRGLHECNITIEPCRYAGQDYDNHHGRNFLKLVSHVSTRMAVDAERNLDSERHRDA
jgi:hypothetical protein